MRTLLLIFTAIVFCTAGFAQVPALTGRVDRRIELTSIVVRLAEFKEYVVNDHKLYAEAVDRHFGKFKGHAAVQLARQLRESNGVSFDAVPSLAVHLKPDLKPKMQFSDSAPDRRWGKKNAEEFARLLAQFARDTESDKFFAAHADLYRLAEERFANVLGKVDLAWYRAFYGEVPRGSFNLYIGLLNGGMNFGPKVVYPDGKEELYAIIGTWKVDEKGLPVYGDEFLSTIIHEFNHSFINHLVYQTEARFRPGGEKIYPPLAEQMSRQAYGTWPIVVLESLVRAAVVRYLHDHEGPERAGAETIGQRANGFVWMDELAGLLEKYEKDRTRYPTFRSYLPVLHSFYTDLGGRIEGEIKEFDDLRPRVVGIDGLGNGDTDVDPGLKEITITFDRPMLGNGRSLSYSDLGAGSYPIKNGFRYDADKTKVTLEVAMEPDKEYGFVLTGIRFRSKEGYPIKNYQVKFKTRK